MKRNHTSKLLWEMTIEERIRRAAWFAGSEAEWQALPMVDRETVAFTATGCRFAYPTWELLP